MIVDSTTYCGICYIDTRVDVMYSVTVWDCETEYCPLGHDSSENYCWETIDQSWIWSRDPPLGQENKKQHSGHGLLNSYSNKTGLDLINVQWFPMLQGLLYLSKLFEAVILLA